MFSPVEQEVLFLTISRFHSCEYCVTAHSVIADTRSKVPVEITDAIRDGKSINDPKLAALNAFTIEMLDTRGLPGTDAVESFQSAGYTEKHLLEIIVAIAIKTLSNYSNHLLNPQVDDPFTGRAWVSK